MEIGDFKKSNISLEDFTKEPTEADGVQLSSKSAGQVAASVTMADGPVEIDSFRMLRESLMTYPGRADLAVQEGLKNSKEVQEFQRSFPDIILSEDLSDEEKMGSIGILKGEASFVPSSSTKRLATTAVLSDSGSAETEETFESRSLLAEVIDEVVAIKREQQSLINEYRARRTAEKGENHPLKDLGELVVPFAEWAQVNQLLSEISDDSTGMLGTQKEKLFNTIKNAPLDQKIELTKNIIDLLDNNDTVLLPDGNDLMTLEVLERMVIDNDYSDFEKWFDNVTTVLDIVGVGAAIGVAADVAKGGGILTRTSRTDVQPASPGEVVKDFNPELSRATVKTVEDDITGEAAEALFGTTREDAIAKAHLPEPEVKPDVVENKVNQEGPQFPEPESVRVVRKRDGETYITPKEAALDKERVIQRAEDVTGFRLQKESTTIKLEDDGSSTFKFMYRPTDSGWNTAAKALENAAYALRDFGATKDQLTLYRRTGEGEWVKTTQDKVVAAKKVRDEFVRKKKKIPPALKDIDYAVGLDYNHRFDPSDFMDSFDKMPVSRLNFLDQFSGLGIFKGDRGSLTQHFFDPRSLLDSKTIVSPAAAAVDRGVRLKKLFVEQFEDFASGYAKLNKQDRARMRDYINDANLDGIRFDEGDLRSRGFGGKDIALLKTWRQANDTLYHASNADMAKSLRMTGRKVLTDGSENTLIVRPMKRGSVGTRTSFYDPSTGDLKTWSQVSNKTIDEFYEEGGEFVKLQTPIEVDGEWIDIAISYGTPNKGYLRAIKDDEIVLAYRDGYYPVMYDANFIVKKKMKDANGNEFNKAVGTSKTREDAEFAARQLNDDEGDVKFFVDQDRRSKVEKSRGILSGEAFEAATSAGLSFQKARGERLFDAGNNLHKAGHTNLLDPLEAVANQIHILSDKTSMRSYLETTKARILSNFKDKVDFPKNKSGEDMYPLEASEIKKGLNGTDKDVADARTMFNYVRQLENGFQNQIIDKGFKAVVNGIADVTEGVSKKGSTILRNMGDASPSSGVKGLAFKLFLAGNPQRQIVIQSSQVNQLTAVFPEYILKGQLAKDLWRLNKAAMGFSKDKEALEMLKQVQEAGFTVAVDANNLVRTESLSLANLKTTDKVKNALNKPLEYAQRLGFDKGEQFVLITSWLAHRADAIKKGKKLNARTYDEIAGEARGYTWDMNKAGDMPYTGNELNVIFQFLQVPHKATLQALTNKQLSKRQKLQLLTWNTAMYGIPSVVLPASVVVYMHDVFGEDSEMTTVLNDGMIDYMLNGVLTAASGEQQAIDFGDFKPTDIMGTATMAISILTASPSTLIQESPSGSLLFGVNPRVQNFVKTTAKWVVPAFDYDNPENQITYKDVIKEGAKLFSGMSNAMKASYAYKTRQKLSGLGNITDDDVTAIEAALAFFGFRTKTEEGVREAKELIYKDSEYNPDDVALWYNELKRVLSLKGITPQEREFHQRVMSEVFAAFEPWETKAQSTLLNLIEKDMTKGNYDFIYDLVRNSGGQSTTEVRKIVLQLPKGDVRSKLLEDLDLIDESIERYKN